MVITTSDQSLGQLVTTLSSKHNKGTLWNILYEKGVFNNLTGNDLDNIKMLFDSTINKYRPSASVPLANLRLVDLNKDVLSILINEIKTAIKNKTDIGLTTVLQNYQFKLHRVAAPIYLATNGIVNLYTSTIFPAKLTRQFILRLVNTVKPVKRAFLSVLE